jgi:hemolysin D
MSLLPSPTLRGRAAERTDETRAAQRVRARPRSDLQFLPAGRAVAATISLFLLLALAWSIIGQVDIIATAEGTVIPVGKSKIVQPAEAGVVRSILVADGAKAAGGEGE